MLILTQLVFASPVQEQENNPFEVLVSKIGDKAGSLIHADSSALKKKTEKNAGKKRRRKTARGKMHDERQVFLQKEQDRKADFFKKNRDKDLTDEARQKAISEFYSKKLERKNKFTEEIKRKVLKNTP